MTNNTEIHKSAVPRRRVHRVLQASAVVLAVLALSQPTSSFAMTASPASSGHVAPAAKVAVPAASKQGEAGFTADDTLSVSQIMNDQAAFELHAFDLVYTN